MNRTWLRLKTCYAAKLFVDDAPRLDDLLHLAQLDGVCPRRLWARAFRRPLPAPTRWAAREAQVRPAPLSSPAGRPRAITHHSFSPSSTGSAAARRHRRSCSEAQGLARSRCSTRRAARSPSPSQPSRSTCIGEGQLREPIVPLGRRAGGGAVGVALLAAAQQLPPCHALRPHLVPVLLSHLLAVRGHRVTVCRGRRQGARPASTCSGGAMGRWRAGGRRRARARARAPAPLAPSLRRPPLRPRPSWTTAGRARAASQEPALTLRTCKLRLSLGRGPQT